MSRSDQLTGLLNRRGWSERLDTEGSRAQRYGHQSWVVMLDLDGLKAVNDTDGHDAGDDLIVRAADALKQAVRNVDNVARTGGDEFAVLLCECGESEARAAVKRIEEALCDRGVQASWGLAMHDPDSGLIGASKRADSLMYEMKTKRHTRIMRA